MSLSSRRKAKREREVILPAVAVHQAAAEAKSRRAFLKQIFRPLIPNSSPANLRKNSVSERKN